MQKNHFETESQLGKILTKRGLISELELKEALAYHRTHKVRLGDALTSLNLISVQELKRALNKQSWLRSLATIALISTPVTSVLAAGSGSLGGSSSASSQITLTVLPKTQAQSKGELKFSASKREATEAGFCPSDWGAELFRVKLDGSGSNGGFYVQNEQKEQLGYQVFYKHQQQIFKPKEPHALSKLYSNSSIKSNCQQAFSNQLKVMFTEEKSNSELSTSASPYNGVLTVTFSVE